MLISNYYYVIVIMIFLYSLQINIKTLKFEDGGRLINASTYGQAENKGSEQALELQSDEKKQYEEIKVICFIYYYFQYKNKK